MALQPEVHGFVMLSNPDTDPEDAPLFLPMAGQNKRPAGTAEPFSVARPQAVVSGFKDLCAETKSWGLEIVRTQRKEINPPTDIQETMNKVVKASAGKIAVIDFATARETQADGERRAAIKVAEGQRQAAILQAEGQKQAVE
jgi:regulator of protease activity HflC (stomatin/prohibitin superfamily)